MTDKEFRKLSRRELLEIMLRLKKELDAAELENESLKKRIEENEKLSRRAFAQLDKMYEAQFGEEYRGENEEASGGGENAEEETEP